MNMNKTTIKEQRRETVTTANENAPISTPPKNTISITEAIRNAGFKNNKTINEAQDPFLNELNEKTILAVLKKNAPWMLEDPRPVYTQNPFNQTVWRGANQLMTQLSNSASQYPYINYAPIYICADKKWLKKMENQDRNALANICYMGKDDRTGDKKYQLVVPTKPLNQNVITEDPLTQPAVPGIAPMPQLPPDFSSVSNLLTQQIAQRLNTAFTKTDPFTPIPWDKSMNQELISQIQQNPALMYQLSHDAFQKSLETKLTDKNQITALLSNNDPSFVNHFVNALANHVINVHTKKEYFTNTSTPWVSQIFHADEAVTKQSVANNISDMMKNPAMLNNLVNSYIDINTNNFRARPNEHTRTHAAVRR
jgi:hypothetical protein